MAKPRTKKHQQRALNTLQVKGFAACALGIAMLTIPMLLGKSPMLAVLGSALRFPGWLALGIGAALLGLHHITRSKLASATVHSEHPPTSWTQSKVIPQEMQKPRFRTQAESETAAPKEQPKPPPYWTQPKVIPSEMQKPRFHTYAETTAVTKVLRAEETQWSPAVFSAIEWRRFEAVCEKLFEQGGFQTKSQSHGADGGVDIWLYSRNAEGPAAVVQCKHWQGKAVGVKELREFFGVMASIKLNRGTYATTSAYTSDAQQFAKDNGINALDGNSLLALIGNRTFEQQQELLAVAYEGEYWRPTCASCGIKLVERTPTKGGAKFWGCDNYPRCKSRLPMVGPLR